MDNIRSHRYFTYFQISRINIQRIEQPDTLSKQYWNQVDMDFVQ